MRKYRVEVNTYNYCNGKTGDVWSVEFELDEDDVIEFSILDSDGLEVDEFIFSEA